MLGTGCGQINSCTSTVFSTT